MRFDTRDQASQFQRYCEDHEIAFELTGIYNQEQPMASAQYGLTPKQRDTLVSALKSGCYNIPQGSMMTE